MYTWNRILLHNYIQILIVYTHTISHLEMIESYWKFYLQANISQDVLTFINNDVMLIGQIERQSSI